jgi:hypothetical protein
MMTQVEISLYPLGETKLSARIDDSTSRALRQERAVMCT